MKFLTTIIVCLLFIISKHEYSAQLFTDGNIPSTFMIPPFHEIAKTFSYGIHYSPRKDFVRNLKNDDNKDVGYQTDWIPIAAPSVVMEKKHDQHLFELSEPINTNGRRGKVLINKNNNQNIFTRKPFVASQPQENRLSFVRFKKILNSKFKQTNSGENRNPEYKNQPVTDFNQIVQNRLDELLKTFEGNLSKILDSAITNASELNKSNRIKENRELDIQTTNILPVEFLGSVHFNAPPTSGISPPGLIASNNWAGPPTEAGYTSPPNLYLNSNDGTLDYGSAQRTHQDVVDRVSNLTAQQHRSVQHRNPYSNDNVNYQSKFPTINNEENRDNYYQTLDANNTDDAIFVQTVTAKYETDPKIPEHGIEIKETTSEKDFDEVRRKIIKEPLTVITEAGGNDGRSQERNALTVEEDEKVDESISRENRVSKRMYPFYTSIDLKGINSFHSGHKNNDLIDNLKGANLLALDKYRREHKINSGYNSLEHAPPDPLVSLFLSHYGRYIPSGHLLSSNFRNIYSYLASNNIHNNKPFGSYKIYEDTDG